MTKKKLRFPILLLVLWLRAAALLPQSYAASGTHRVEVQSGTGYTSSEVGINVWENGVARDVSFAPLDGYRITALHVSYSDASASAAIKAEQMPAQLTVGGIMLPLKYTGRTVTVTVPGNCTGDLTLSAATEAASCMVAVTADSGIDVSSGGTYGIGKAVTITAAPSGDAAVTRVPITRTDADLADGAVQVGEKTYPFSVTLRLTNVQTDMQVYFASELDEGHVPITTLEGTGMDIDKDCGSTVSKGTDVRFTISAEANYRLSRITLSVDGISRTVDADEDEITVDGVDYELQQNGSDVILYVDDVYAPIKVSAAASKLTTYDHSVTISPSTRCRTVPYRPPAQVSIMAARRRIPSRRRTATSLAQ